MRREAHNLLRKDIHRKDKDQAREGQATGVRDRGYRKAST